MEHETLTTVHRPRIAIADANTLAVVGLRTILQDVMPIMDVDVYGSFAELLANNPSRYYHYFVAMNIVLANRAFFMANRHKTIVLTTSLDQTAFADFHTLAVNVAESVLVKSILALEQHAHGRGQHLPVQAIQVSDTPLSPREAEVLSLVAQGVINKEIADRLNIGITTVISHRKNIQEKLGLKSVSALTIYAVTHGYVDINKI